MSQPQPQPNPYLELPLDRVRVNIIAALKCLDGVFGRNLSETSELGRCAGILQYTLEHFPTEEANSGRR